MHPAENAGPENDAPNDLAHKPWLPQPLGNICEQLRDSKNQQKSQRQMYCLEVSYSRMAGRLWSVESVIWKGTNRLPHPIGDPDRVQHHTHVC